MNERVIEPAGPTLRPSGKRHRVRAALTLALLVAAGCSSGESTAPETIEGKSPADYREAAERGVVESVPPTPKAAGKAR